MPGIYVRSEGGTLRQGEIITNLPQFRLNVDMIGTDSQEADFELHPFAVVLSQDCDLEQDWKARQPPAVQDPNAAQRLLPSVLLAQVHRAADLRGRAPSSDLWKRIKQNKDERYHFLEATPAEEDALGEGLEELGIDFKRYFTIPTDEIYKRLEGDVQRRCRLISPYLEHLSTRFCYYQFRVALPAEHQST